MQHKTLTPRQAEWRQLKGEIIARFGTLTACAEVVECSPQSLRACVLTDALPGIREKLTAVLLQPEAVAA